jgi:Family of unknown function (DUF6445)
LVKPELRRIGALQSPVVVIDEFTGNVEAVARLADALAPYPFSRDGYYPGIRKLIRREDLDADAYVERLCEEAAQFIAGAFEFDSFDLVEASFSMVTTAPGRLAEPQRMPHFDSTDAKYLALLHYLRVPDGTGTAFYRQGSTGIEVVTDDNCAEFLRVAQAEAKQMPPESGYIYGSNDFFEQVGAVEAVPDRLVIYQGSLLHSGIIPPGMNFSTDPREGRLTANIFVRGH